MQTTQTNRYSITGVPPGPNFVAHNELGVLQELGIVSRTERAASLLAKSGKFSGGKQGSQCLSPTPKRIRVARLLFKSGEQSCVSNSGVLLSPSRLVLVFERTLRGATWKGTLQRLRAVNFRPTSPSIINPKHNRGGFFVASRIQRAV